MMFPEGGGEGDLDGMVFPKLPPGEPPKPFTGHRHRQLDRIPMCEGRLANATLIPSPRLLLPYIYVICYNVLYVICSSMSRGETETEIIMVCMW